MCLFVCWVVVFPLQHCRHCALVFCASCCQETRVMPWHQELGVVERCCKHCADVLDGNVPSQRDPNADQPGAVAAAAPLTTAAAKEQAMRRPTALARAVAQ